MSSSLLEKMRKINGILHRSTDGQLSYFELSKALSRILDANVYVLGVKGNLFGFSLSEGYSCSIMEDGILEDRKFPKDFNRDLMEVKEIRVVAVDDVIGCVFDDNIKCPYETRYMVFIPIYGGNERLGTLLLTRFGKEFDEEDVVLGEHSATIVALQMLHTKNLELEEEERKKAVVQMAIETLSYSEMEAMEHIFAELQGKEGLLVASKIADRVGITRSVIVNALRKLESAGVIESRSLGMKGTYIKILNDKFTEQLNRMQT